MERNRTQQTIPLDERLQKAANNLRARAGDLRAGEERNALLDKAEQYERQIAMNEALLSQS